MKTLNAKIIYQATYLKNEWGARSSLHPYFRRKVGCTWPWHPPGYGLRACKTLLNTAAVKRSEFKNRKSNIFYLKFFPEINQFKIEKVKYIIFLGWDAPCCSLTIVWRYRYGTPPHVISYFGRKFINSLHLVIVTEIKLNK